MQTVRILWLVFFFNAFTAGAHDLADSSYGTMKISFIVRANRNIIELKNRNYQTPLGELYNISKLKFYISNIELPGNTILKEEDNFHLMDIAANTSLVIPVKPGNYTGISFLIGVDSLHNCSGAQTGALDPINDMFWTWNSGYVIFKLEGTSPESKADKNRIEYHIGGYRSGNNVSTRINFDFKQPQHVSANELQEIFIEVDLDKLWKDVNELSIRQNPVCAFPGQLAKKISENFRSMFSLRNNEE